MQNLTIKIDVSGTIHEVRNAIVESGVMGHPVTGRCTNKIQMIKWARNRYGLSLLNAKTMVEYILENQTHD